MSRMVKRWGWLTGLLILAAGPAYAQNTTAFSASNIQNLQGTKLGSGTLYIQGTDQANTPISFQCGGGGQVVRTPYTTTVTTGAIVTFNVCNPANTIPAGIYYHVWVIDQTSGSSTYGQTILNYGLVQWNGATFNFDNYTPTGNVSPPVGLNVTGNFGINGNLSVTGSIVGGGYYLTPGSGLTLNVAAGAIVCPGGSTVDTYAGGTLTMAASSTNYVGLNESSSCAPLSNTTGFTSTIYPLATVVTSGSAITSITRLTGMTVVGQGPQGSTGPTGPTGATGPPGTTGLGSTCNNINVICAEQEGGADFGSDLQLAINQAFALANSGGPYALSGATVDARNFTCPANCQINSDIMAAPSSSNRFSGNQPTVHILLPVGNIQRNVNAATGLSAHIYYGNSAWIQGQGKNVTDITGPSDGDVFQPVPGGYGGAGKISDLSTSSSPVTGTVTATGTAVTWVSGSKFNTTGSWVGAAMEINGAWNYIASVNSSTSITLVSSVSGGPYASAKTYYVTAIYSAGLSLGGLWPWTYIPNELTVSPLTVNLAGLGLTGYMAHLAFYNTTLTPAQIANHYSLQSSPSSYNTQVVNDGATDHWIYGDSSGTTAVDAINSSNNGTYTGTFTLGTANSGISGGATDYAVLLGGGDVTLHSAAYMANQTNWTMEGWYKPTATFSIYSPPYQVSLCGSIYYNCIQNNTIGVVAADNHGSLYTRQLGNHAAGLADDQNTWIYWAITYNHGLLIFYQQGLAANFGTDGNSMKIADAAFSGAESGVFGDSANGCICYCMLTDVDASGTLYSAKFTNSSGYGFGVNHDKWDGGNLSSGPIGLLDSGTYNFIYNFGDFESNATTAGGILYAHPVLPNTGISTASGYTVGDTLRPTTGGNSDAVITVASVVSGVPQALTITVPGTAYGNGTVQGAATTNITGSGTGLTIDYTMSAHILGLSNGGPTITGEYEEGGGADYICGNGYQINFQFSTNGATYSPYQCTGPSTVYYSPNSNFFWGSGATPNSIALNSGNSYIGFGDGAMYDPGFGNTYQYSRSYTANLFFDGPIFAGGNSQVYGEYGHALWQTGLLEPHAGQISTGAVEHNKLATPTAPTLTVYPTGSTTSANYYLVCSDYFGNHTLGSPAAQTTTGPSALGAWQNLTIVSGGSAYVQGDVGSTFTISAVGGYGSGGVGTITQVNNGSGTGPVTGISLTTAGAGYNTLPNPGGSYGTVFATVGGTGTGLTVTGKTSYIEANFPDEDGCFWSVYKGSSTISTAALMPNSLSGNGTTNAGKNLIDFGAATGATYAVTRNATADVTLGGYTILSGANVTPADNATCTAGTIWWDASYLYVCTASGTVKRAALSTF